ncbi:MAG: helix-turn-helix transcriptional regulator [Raoultibacter sp.]
MVKRQARASQTMKNSVPTSAKKCRAQQNHGNTVYPEELKPIKINRLLPIFGSVNWLFVLGFALCQTWNILCVAIPNPFSYEAASPDLRWLSLTTAVVLTGVAVTKHTFTAKLLKENITLYAIGITAATGSLLGPLSALFSPTFSLLLIYASAIMVGVGFSLLFLAWYTVFCNTHDMNGLALSVAICALLTYPLANMLELGLMNQWVAAALASALPIFSVIFLRTKNAKVPHRPLQLVDTRKKFLIFRYCLCLFLVTTVIETVRNLLLNGAALSFYSGGINLGMLMLKLICFVPLLLVFDSRNARDLSFVYRAAFLLLLGVVLCIPYIIEGNLVSHGLLDVSAFLFELIMMIAAYEISIAFNLEPLVVMGGARIAWGCGVLSGIGLNTLCAFGGPESIPLLSIILGLATASAFTFVFTDHNCTDILATLPAPPHTSKFKTRCEQLAVNSGISERELEVMFLIAKGRSATRVADDLTVSTATVNSHIHHIYQKLNVHSRQEMIDLIDAEKPDKAH